MPTDPARPRRLAAASLFLLVLAAVAMVAAPLWLVQPFSPQTPEGLAWAFALRRWAPWATLLAVALGAFLLARLWRGGRWWSRTLATLAVLVLLGTAWAARQNVYERMFSPISGARFATADQAAWVEDGDPVIAVALNGEAAAYPVRQVAYHHIVQDEVGGVPVAVTY